MSERQSMRTTFLIFSKGESAIFIVDHEPCRHGQSFLLFSKLHLVEVRVQPVLREQRIV